MTVTPDRPRMSDRVKAVRPDEWIAISVFALTVVASTYTWFGLAQSAHFPNLIAVNFYARGDVFRVVDTLNRVPTTR